MGLAMISRVANTRCIVCGSDLHRPAYAEAGRDIAIYECPRCGTFEVTGTDSVVVPNKLASHDDRRLLVSHFIHRMRRTNGRPILSSKTVENILQSEKYPTPVEQLDNLILLIGENAPGPGHTVAIDLQTDVPFIGAYSDKAFKFVGEAGIEQGLLKVEPSPAQSASTDHERLVKLTFKGWSRFEELKRGAPSGRRAFMAMKFGDAELDNLLESQLKPAVALTGFTLQTVGDNRKAGLIDDKIRVDIRAARFLIADLTHANNGAYWEAGYAEGLGKPVIYICRQDIFDSEKTRPHFDTNHHTTVMWSLENLQQAMDDLKATIRATLPEARQED